MSFFEDDRPAALEQPLMDLAKESHASRYSEVDLPTWNDSVDDLLVSLGIPKAELSSAVSLSRS